MPDLPTLTIDIFPPIQGNQPYCLKLTLSGLTTNNEEKDVGKLELPFQLDMVPLIQYLLNLKQEYDKPSQLGPLQSLKSSESLKKPTISDAQENMLSQLKLLDNMGRVVDDVHEKVGELLGSALLNNKVFKDSLQEFYKAVGKTDDGDIVLRFDKEAWGLTALPWELAFNGSKPLLVPQEAQTVLGCTRIISDQPLPSNDQPLLSAKQHPSPTYSAYDKLRILAVASYWAMNDDDRNRETIARLRLKEALKDIGIVECKPHITMSALASRLNSGPPVDILDYFGHGSFENGHAVLAMEDDNRGIDPISPAKLYLLKNLLPPIVVLYACHSAQVDINNSFDSFAYSLINYGVQAVIAMQFKIRMQVVSEHVVWTFYKSLANEYSLPKALTEVRRKLLIEEKEKNSVSWFVPALYMREFNQQPYLLQESASRPPRNPFADPGAVTDSNFFVGREELVQQLREWLQSRGHRSIVGPTGSGKSSMLTLLRAEVRKKQSAKVVKLSPKRLWTLHDAERELAQELGGQKRSELKQKLRRKNLILLLDDIEKLAECEEGYDICDWLRTLAEEGYDYTVRLVVTSSKPLKEMANDDMFQLLSQAIKGEIELGPFNEAEARDFISSRLKEVGNPFEVKDFEDLLHNPEKSLIPGHLESTCRDRYEELCNSKEKRAKILFRTFR